MLVVQKWVEALQTARQRFKKSCARSGAFFCAHRTLRRKANEHNPAVQGETAIDHPPQPPPVPDTTGAARVAAAARAVAFPSTARV